MLKVESVFIKGADQEKLILVFNMVTIPMEIFGTHISIWITAWITDCVNILDVFVIKCRLRFRKDGKTVHD